jgi:hypothetical protein
VTGPAPGGIGGAPAGSASAVGPLAVEAALLLDAVTDRLTALKPPVPQDVPPPAAETPGPAGTSADGRPPGPDGRCPECGSVPGASCAACPLCRFLAVLRGERPETTARLVDGALLIVRTLRSMIPEPGQPAPPGPPGSGPTPPSTPPPSPAPPRRGGLQRIDIL